tara:strand:+ start:230 stop:1096 length:867 start_codon:yes stop_codon:yes gene_type:complete
MINIVCTSKPGDGLLCYSYEHCCYLNSIGIKSQVVIITHHKFTKEDYINSVKEKYITCDNIVFDDYTPASGDISLILGRSQLTLPYKDKKDYTNDQLLTMHLLFGGNLISVYGENQHELWQPALKYFNNKKVYNLCDFDVYPNGEGQQYEKMINFEVYKPVVNDIKFDYLFLGTNDVYYKEIEKHIDNYKSHGILTYNEKYIIMDYNNIFAPVKNLLGLFKSYVYTKTYFDPAPRLIQECKWLGKEVIYLRDKNIKDGGPVYMKRPVPTKEMYKENINILVKLIMDLK